MYLLENTPEADEMIENVIQLLRSDATESQALALELIKGGGFPKKLYVLVWWIAFQRTGSHKNDYTHVIDLSIQQECFKLIQSLNQSILIPKYFKDEYDYNDVETSLREDFDEILKIDGFYLEDFLEYILPHYHHLEEKQEVRGKKWKTRRFFLQKFWDAPHISKKKILEKIISTDKTTLRLDYLEIQELPEEVFELKSLTYLSFKETNIAQIPEKLYLLPNLQRIIYEKTPLTKGGKFLKYLEKNFPQIAARTFYDKCDLNSYWNQDSIYKVLPENPRRKALTKALQLWNNYPEALLAMARIHSKFENEREEAMVCYQNFLKEHSNWQNFNILDEYFNFLNKTKLYAVLIQNFEILEPYFSPYLAQMPNYTHANLWFYKALAHFWLQDYEQCLSDNFYSVKINDYAGTHYNIACGYAKLSKKTEMLLYLENALKKDRYHYYVMATVDEDKDFEDFKEDKDFQKLLKKYK